MPDPWPIELTLTPRGALRAAPGPSGPTGSAGAGADPGPIQAAFAQGSGHGIFHLGTFHVETRFPPSVTYWRDFGCLFVTRLCALPDLESQRTAIALPFPEEEASRLILSVPPMIGGEYLTLEVLRALWDETLEACRREIGADPRPIEELLHSRSPVWNLMGKVHFHLAENKRSPSTPFAFLATYTARLGGGGKIQHLPLGQALKEYGGAGNRSGLLALLKPVQAAAEKSPLLKSLVDSGALFHPLSWAPEEAYRFLMEVEAFESAGIMVRVPDWWSRRALRRPQVRISVGGTRPAGLGMGALLDFSVDVALDGERLSGPEIQELTAHSEGLVLLRGRWVEIDGERLSQVLAHWRELQKSTPDGVTFLEAMRLLAGESRDASAAEVEEEADPWSVRVAGPWLESVFSELQLPDALRPPPIGDRFEGKLRPYQEAGLAWLWRLQKLRLGGCLADDMGLGKTIQVIALWCALGQEKARGPHLLVVPASLVSNWRRELDRFGPGLKVAIAHPSVPRTEGEGARDWADHDVVITTYGYLPKLEWVPSVSWDLVIADEAQAIKNPGTIAARALKALSSRARLVMTGTPVENRLGDLWSLFDFINPGLLGSSRSFTAFTRRLAERSHDQFGPLRTLVRPYILRRLKTDRRVIADLPEKTELLAHCTLSKEQAALYQKSVETLAGELEKREGIDRRGMILAYLTRFKQILNHPTQWLRDGSWDAGRSGKFRRLGELMQEIGERQEKCLVFTQYKEMVEPLSRFLSGTLGRDGLVLHGETPVKERQKRVDRFQTDEEVPFLVLSLKAGGTGLNLTAANHVIHFDRWWNPAVEDQATDRAFRIGQTRNVLVHKFLCRGTLEEKIQGMIESKKKVAREVLAGGGEISLTEMSNAELLGLVSLDIHSIDLDM